MVNRQWLQVTTFHYCLFTIHPKHTTAPQHYLQGSVCFNFNLSIETIFNLYFLSAGSKKKKGWMKIF